jgi:hypothetical protein
VKSQGPGSAGTAPVLPATPRRRERRLIPIQPGPAVSGARGENPDRYAYWSDYYLKHDESSAQLRETVRLLNLSRKFTDVHAALTGYLQHTTSPEPWMYEALALAVEMIQGKPEDVHTALRYAADLAQKSHNPNHLVSVADKLLLKGDLERVGPLLDEAASRVPHRAEPLVMSINLAQKTKDPKRMADSIDRLLSLGWPGNDEYFRREARSQAEKLAATLNREGRTEEANNLVASLPAAESRDVVISLTWDGDADFDLAVTEPLGAVAQYAMPRTVFGGSIIKNGYGNHPEELYVCPRGFNGNYTVRIATVYTNPNKPPTRLTLETVTHEGTPEAQKRSVTLVPDDPGAKPAVVTLKDGRRKTVLPFVSPAAILEPRGEAPKGSKPSRDRRQSPPAAAKPGTPRS